LSVNKNRIIRKCLLVLAILTTVTIELAILLTFLNIYNLLSTQLYWSGLIALLAAFFVSVHVLQTVAEVKFPT
jgi:hypothetical protein